MKCTAKNLLFGFALIAVSTALVSILCLRSAHSQEVKPITADIKPDKPARQVCKDQHSRKDLFKNIRLLEPATVLEIIGNRLNYVISGEGLELASLDLENGLSRVPEGFSATKHQGCFGIYYCQKHLVVLQIDELEDKFCQTPKG